MSFQHLDPNQIKKIAVVVELNSGAQVAVEMVASEFTFETKRSYDEMMFHNRHHRYASPYTEATMTVSGRYLMVMGKKMWEWDGEPVGEIEPARPAIGAGEGWDVT